VAASAQIGSDGTVIAATGIVATSHPLAAEAGAQALRDGGSAADAAVAAAAVLAVVEPGSTGVGGDAFALWWGPGDAAPRGLAGAGPAPAGMSIDALRAAGHDAMPAAGPWSVTVPGSVSLWERLLEAHGRLEPTRVLAPAIDLAEQGFAVTPVIAGEWAAGASRLAVDARARFLPGGRAPAAGERFANPALGTVLRRIAEDGAAAFYTGPVAEALGSAIRDAGGPLGAEDLAAFRGATWVEPIQSRFRDVDVYQLPPPGQGLVTLQALGIYERLGGADEEHALVEALKAAFADGAAYIADPDHAHVPVEALLAGRYLDRRAAEIDPARAAVAVAGRPGDTVYVAVADADGGACSFIQSLYDGFGSGLEAMGVLLQNRGNGFVLEPEHPNRPEPGKRPYHTIIPAMLARDGRLAGVLGVVGGFMQPQGQVQVLRALLDRGLGPQAALDAPRLRIEGGLRVDLEDGFDAGAAEALRARGHDVGRLESGSAGGAQLVLVREDGGFAGASERRKDGRAVAR
jgi:gamma-glutamyltranspeptidase / glutathione hydrolase